MSFYVEATSHREFKMVPPGTHLARCYRLVDLGTQTVDWQGQQKFQHKIMLGWEIHGEDDQGQPLVTDEGEPLAMFKNYTHSWSENATLRKDLQTWRVHLGAMTKPSALTCKTSSANGAWST